MILSSSLSKGSSCWQSQWRSQQDCGEQCTFCECLSEAGRGWKHPAKHCQRIGTMH